MYRDTCMPWIEDTTNCSICGIDTESNDMLCDDCDAVADEMETLDECVNTAPHRHHEGCLPHCPL